MAEPPRTDLKGTGGIELEAATPSIKMERVVRPSATLSMPEPHPQVLLRRLAAGDHAALGEFYDLYAGLANGLALRILRDTSEAEDVVQEVFVQVWRQASRFDPERGTPEAWLCTMARTRALDRLRRRTSRREDPGDPSSAATESPRTEEALAVRKALEGLTADQRRALELAYYEGLTQSEIATRLGEPLGTIKTRIRTAMIRLREVLGPVAT
jgi:RNA polymerase sigma-70 factor, ECF subfamily